MTRSLASGSPDNLLSGCGSAPARTHKKPPGACAPFRLLLVAFGDPDNKLSGLPLINPSPLP
jgi:hypothetical protein